MKARVFLPLLLSILSCAEQEEKHCPGIAWEFSYNIPGESEVWKSVNVPGYWTESGQLPNTGTGRYRLRVSCKMQAVDSLHIAEISSAAIVYWNGLEIARSGEPGIDRKSERGRIAPLYVRLPDSGPGLLEIQVSNFHARAGGILGLAFGREVEFRNARMRSIVSTSKQTKIMTRKA